MDPELEACFDRWEASFDALYVYLDTAAGVTGPVTASAATNELAIRSEGIVPASCSTECAAQAVTLSTTTSLLLEASGLSPSCASPATPATNGVVSTELASGNDAGELAVPAAGDGNFDDEVTKGAASTAITSSSGSPHSGISASACAFISTLSLSAAPTVRTCTEISDTQVWQPFCVQVRGTLAPVNRVCLDAFCLSDQVPTIQAIQSLSLSWHQELMDCHTPWPPPVEINLSGFSSFTQMDTKATLSQFPWNPGPAMRSSSAVLYDEWVLPSCDSEQQAVSSYDQCPCAVRNASYDPGYFVTGGHMQITTEFSAEQLYGILMVVFELVGTKSLGMIRELGHCWDYTLQVWLSWRLDFVMGWGIIVLACLQNGQKNSDLPVLRWLLEQEDLNSGFQLQQGIILADWYLHNQSILVTVHLFNSFRYYLLADKLRSRLICLWQAHAVFHAFVLPESHPTGVLPIDHLPRWAWQITSTNARQCAISFHVMELQGAYVSLQLQWDNMALMFSWMLIPIGELCRKWKFEHYAIDRCALMVLIQSVALKYMERWFTIAIWTEIMIIFDAGFSLQMGALQYASFELLVFMEAFVGGQEPFQGGRHIPIFYRHRELRSSWDPGGVAAACGQASIAVIAVTTFSQQVSAGHKYYLDFNQVRANGNYYPNFGYYRDSGQIKDHRLLWDPGGFSVMLAWGQAEFQGGRDVRNLYYRCWYLGWPMGRHMGLVGHRPSRGCTLHIRGRRQRWDYPEGSRTARRRLPLPPRL